MKQLNLDNRIEKMAITLNIIKDQSLSDQVNAWLANNKATQFKIGEVHEVKFIRTGSSKLTVQENVATEKTREAKKIEEQEKARLKKQQAVEALKIILEQRLANQQQLVSNFRNNAIKGDFARFMREFHYTKTVFDSAMVRPIRNDQSYERFCNSVMSFKHAKFEEKVKKIKPEKEKTRHRNIIEKRREALEAGKTKFIAECKHHGIVDYITNKNGSARCSQCKKESETKYIENRKSKVKSEKQLRIESNRDAMNAAIQKKSTVKAFIGVCEKHGETIFLIIKNEKQKGNEAKYRCRCHQCKMDNAKIFRERRLQQM